jgi:tripartite-type tricarboxylate transporter receptor subunit TctC
MPAIAAAAASASKLCLRAFIAPLHRPSISFSTNFAPPTCFRDRGLVRRWTFADDLLKVRPMKLPRRAFLQLAAGAALPAAARSARAQAYPSRPVRIVVGFAAGGTGDILCRLIGQWLSERLGQPFVIENRGGAGGNIAAEAVVRAAPDGHTLLQVGTANAVNTTLYENLDFDFIRDIAPVAGLARARLVLQVNPSLPVTTVPELIAYAKAHPGKLNMASAGNGTSPHLAGELFKMMTGVDIVHVPYRGGGLALTDLIGGRVQVMFTSLPTAALNRTGKLRAIAVTTATRAEALPDVPTVGEFVPGYEASGWYGLGAPKQTPAAIIDGLNRAINAGLVDPQIKARLADLDGVALTGSPADFGRLIAEETEKWGKVVRFAGVKAQ